MANIFIDGRDGEVCTRPKLYDELLRNEVIEFDNFLVGKQNRLIDARGEANENLREARADQDVESVREFTSKIRLIANKMRLVGNWRAETAIILSNIDELTQHRA